MGFINSGVDANGDTKIMLVSECGGKCAYRGTCLNTIRECYQHTLVYEEDIVKWQGKTYRVFENGDVEMIDVS